MVSPQSSLCKIGIFQFDDDENEKETPKITSDESKTNYSRIWSKSTDETERRRWAWKNPGLGSWEIKLEVTNERMTKTASTKFTVRT